MSSNKTCLKWCSALSIFAAAAVLTQVTASDAAAGDAAPALSFDVQEATGAAEPSALGPLSPLQIQAMQRGTLPAGPADLAAKESANAAAIAAEAAGPVHPRSARELAPAGGGSEGALAPTIPPGTEKAGQIDANSSPSDATGAVGRTRFVQLVNRRFGIYAKGNLALSSSGTLADFVGLPVLNVFDPQVIWDDQTRRFYYVADAVASSSDNRLAFGYSKTASPNNGTTDWCKYFINYGSRFPDYPKLGDSKHFLIVGANSFGANFVGSDLFAISKPPSGASCAPAASFIVSVRQNLTDSSGGLVFTPVAANSADTLATGYVVARNLSLPSNKFWMFTVTRNANGTANFGGNGQPITLPASVGVPPDASQAGLTQRLDTLDARPTQAILAKNPRRGNQPVIWTQHTVGEGSVAAIRFYEISVGRTVLSNGLIGTTTSHLYNAAISPDRKAGALGGSFVIEYSVSGSASGFNPRIVAGSSVNGAPLSFVLVEDAVGPYRDFTCSTSGSTCRWGDYSGLTPDPTPPAGSVGLTWGTNQFAGSTSTSTSSANWRTRVFALKP